MTSGRSIRKSGVAYEILAYLAENPEAQDTIDGIAQWWLLDRRIKEETHNVIQAVETLVAGKYLITKQGRDSSIRYRLNPAMREKIQHLLKGS